MSIERADDPNRRLTGLVYLAYFVTAIASAIMLSHSQSSVTHEPYALGDNGLYQAAISVELLSNLLYVTLTVMFLRLTSSAGRTLALVVAAMSFAGCGIQLAAQLFELLPIALAKHPLLHDVLTPDSASAVSSHALALHSQALFLALVCFGFYNCGLATLLRRASLVPRWSSSLLLLSGLGWLLFLWPPLAVSLRVVVLPVGMLAELGVMACLLVGRGPSEPQGDNLPTAA